MTFPKNEEERVRLLETYLSVREEIDRLMVQAITVEKVARKFQLGGQLLLIRKDLGVE